jgi:hypothetical protein
MTIYFTLTISFQEGCEAEGLASVDLGLEATSLALVPFALYVAGFFAVVLLVEDLGLVSAAGEEASGRGEVATSDIVK